MTGAANTTGSPDGRGGRVLSDIAYRLRKYFHTFGTRDELSPHGDWIQAQSSVTRRVWEGYGTRVVLETELTPGNGWRFYLEPPNADAIHVPSLERDDTGDMRVWVTPFDDLSEAPRNPREYAFRVVERLMSTYAMENYEGQYDRDPPQRK